MSTSASASAARTAFGLRPGPREQARARHWRERHGDLQLGIIAPAGALERLRPAVVEDVFPREWDFT
jgi:hypothetical protein